MLTEELSSEQVKLHSLSLNSLRVELSPDEQEKFDKLSALLMPREVNKQTTNEKEKGVDRGQESVTHPIKNEEENNEKEDITVSSIENDRKDNQEKEKHSYQIGVISSVGNKKDKANTAPDIIILSIEGNVSRKNESYIISNEFLQTNENEADCLPDSMPTPKYNPIEDSKPLYPPDAYTMRSTLNDRLAVMGKAQLDGHKIVKCAVGDSDFLTTVAESVSGGMKESSLEEIIIADYNVIQLMKIVFYKRFFNGELGEVTRENFCKKMIDFFTIINDEDAYSYGNYDRTIDYLHQASQNFSRDQHFLIPNSAYLGYKHTILWDLHFALNNEQNFENVKRGMQQIKVTQVLCNFAKEENLVKFLKYLDSKGSPNKELLFNFTNVLQYIDLGMNFEYKTIEKIVDHFISNTSSYYKSHLVQSRVMYGGKAQKDSSLEDNYHYIQSKGGIRQNPFITLEYPYLEAAHWEETTYGLKFFTTDKPELYPPEGLKWVDQQRKTYTKQHIKYIDKY